MEFSSQVRRRFRAPARAGEIPQGSGIVFEGQAEDRSLAVWVRFQIELKDSAIGRVRFRAYGCPHVIAAADCIAEALEGRSTDELASIDLAELARGLGLPREKFGKLLCLEDALAACTAQAAAVGQT
jgi:NifU-like protein involved in Fe-S cluster formation